MSKFTPPAAEVPRQGQPMTAWIEELERLHAEATPGPWEVSGHFDDLDAVITGPWLEELGAFMYVAKVGPRATPALIAAMRNALPRLLAAARLATEIAERDEQIMALWDLLRELKPEAPAVIQRIMDLLARP